MPPTQANQLDTLEEGLQSLQESIPKMTQSLEERFNEMKHYFEEKQNKIDECYIRPLAIFGYGKMGINPLNNKVSLAIALWKWDEYLKKEDVNHGVRVMVSGWMRIDARTMPIHAKATANYANSALARIEAIKAGFDEALMLNTDGMVVEASGENIFIVKNNVLITPPTASGALEGITRDTVLRLAKDDNIVTEIRDISKDELYLADEVFLTGTAAEIKAVGEIDNRRIGNGGIEKITLELKSLFDDLTRGNHKYSTEWLSYINID